MDEYHRAITKAEERFFSECDMSSGTCLILTSSSWWLMMDFGLVPVIAVFMKFSVLWDNAYRELKESGKSWMESKEMAPEKAKEIFTKMKIWD